MVWICIYHKTARCTAFGRPLLPGFSSFLSLSLLLFLLLLLSEVDSPLSVLVSPKITSAAFSIRTVAACASWPVYTPGLFTPCLTGTWDLETLLHTDQVTHPYLGTMSVGCFFRCQAWTQGTTSSTKFLKNIQGQELVLNIFVMFHK